MSIALSRRALLRGLTVAAGAGLIPSAGVAANMSFPAATPITVYRSPTCGCCLKWVEHLTANGFAATVREVEDIEPVKTRLGVTDDVRSCHTAEVEGYAIEGHVPASAIRKLLAERPKVAGIGVPGMPVGSPGMEMGMRKDPFDVIAFGPSGNRIFARF